MNRHLRSFWLRHGFWEILNRTAADLAAFASPPRQRWWKRIWARWKWRKNWPVDAVAHLERANAAEAEISLLKELLEQAEVDMERKVDSELRWRIERAESILRIAASPRRPDGTYNLSREALEQMANDYFAVVVPVEKQPSDRCWCGASDRCRSNVKPCMPRDCLEKQPR